jgi:ubiquinone/menaquinone biosynthesis C-methylase UbiE
MTERYDDRAASHYAAYRPPLHRMILRRILSDRPRFNVGLDVGCGTGYSAVALADYCDGVFGVDPSEAMLKSASGHPKVTYVRAAADRLPLAARSSDVVTFAGSLFYADSGETRAEIRRVCPSGTVIIYDFEVLLGHVLKQCGIDTRAPESYYDHRANFSGADGFTELVVNCERVALELTMPQLAHVLLSDSNRLDQFARKYRDSDPFDVLVEELERKRRPPAIDADIYYSKYRMRPEPSN